jgi:hypothetical protein
VDVDVALAVVDVSQGGLIQPLLAQTFAKPTPATTNEMLDVTLPGWEVTLQPGDEILLTHRAVRKYTGSGYRWCSLVDDVAIEITSLLPILSINATYLDSSFTPAGGAYGRGVLTIADDADVVVEDPTGQFTYEGGSLSIVTSLLEDRSADGLVAGDFLGGELIVRDEDGADLLTGNLMALEIEEVFDGQGCLCGRGSFEVTGGLLADAWGEEFGEIVQITFDIDPTGIDDLSSAFTGLSNVTLEPVPEPATLSLLAAVGLVFLRRGPARGRSTRRRAAEWEDTLSPLSITVYTTK